MELASAWLAIPRSSSRTRVGTVESLADCFAAAAPALVVLEDLQGADPIAIWVLEQLPRALGDASIALLATSRDNEVGMTPLDALR